MNWFMNLLTSNKVKELEEENNQLKDQLNDCSMKLVEKQLHINKTNAYWKKKMRELPSSKPKKK
jgi:peptidoglycan hydrolase CwlO-like protein